MSPLDGSSLARFINNAAKSYTPSTKLIGKVADLSEYYFFGFRFFTIDHTRLDCQNLQRHKHGARLLNVFRLLRDISLNTPDTLAGHRHCHELKKLTSQKIEEFQLQPYIDQAPDGKLFQLGLDGGQERIVGFFDKEQTHLFHVCLFDLLHEIFPQAKRYVFDPSLSQ